MPPTDAGIDTRSGVELVQRTWKEVKAVSHVRLIPCMHYLLGDERTNPPHEHPLMPRCYHIILLLRWECRLRLCELGDEEQITSDSIPLIAQELSESVVAECPFVLPSPPRVVVSMLRRMVREYAENLLPATPSKSLVSF